MLEDVIEEIKQDYSLYLQEEHLEDNDESLDKYITCQYYDIADSLDVLQEYYKEMQGMEYIEQITFIENKIENIIRGL